MAGRQTMAEGKSDLIRIHELIYISETALEARASNIPGSSSRPCAPHEIWPPMERLSWARKCGCWRGQWYSQLALKSLLALHYWTSLAKYVVRLFMSSPPSSRCIIFGNPYYLRLPAPSRYQTASSPPRDGDASFGRNQRKAVSALDTQKLVVRSQINMKQNNFYIDLWLIYHWFKSKRQWKVGVCISLPFQVPRILHYRSVPITYWNTSANLPQGLPGKCRFGRPIW